MENITRTLCPCERPSWLCVAALAHQKKSCSTLNTDATLDDLREAVTRLEELAPYARRILGGTHPGTTVIERTLRDAQAALRAAEQS